MFLNELDSYATLHNIFQFDDQRKIAAFYLHLTGPALPWFNALTSTSKVTWKTFLKVFKAKYVNLDWQSPTVLLETEVFENMRLAPGQSIDDFHCQLVEKASMLHKQDHEVLAKFIKGLPEKLAFFVHAGNPKDSATALSAARMGEAYDSCIGRSNGCSRM